MDRKKLLFIIGLILIAIGIVAFLYAQNEINSSWGYTWTQPYSDYENKIVSIKNIGICALVLGIGDIAAITFKKMWK